MDGSTRKMYQAEDAGEGCWMEKPHKPVPAWAIGKDWWKCGRCGQGHEPDEDKWACKFCGQIREEGNG